MIKYQFRTLAICCIFISSCIGPKKINKWVTKQYAESVDVKPKMQNDYLSVTSTLTTTDASLCTDSKQTKNVLPLIFYWRFDYINNCTLNPKIPVSEFMSTVLTYANSKGLKQKLNGQRIELSVDKIPNFFALNDRAHVIWVVYAYGWDNISIKPDNQEMVVAYKILKDNVEVKKGEVSIPNEDKGLTVKWMHSVKNTTSQYFEQYDENIKTMSKKVIDKIMSEL